MTLILTYTCSEQDYLRATWLLLRKRQRSMLLLSVMCGLVLLYVVVELCFIPGGRSSFAALSLLRILLPVSIFLLPLLSMYTARMTYRRNSLVSETRTMTFDDSGYSTESASASGRVSWAAYERFYEDRHTFLLMQRGSRIFVPIPKRQMSPEQINWLHTLLKAHIAGR